MSKPRHVFIQLTSEDDFLKAFARDACDIDGAFHLVFHWTTDFHEEIEPTKVLVWINKPGLPPNFYHESFLRSITAPVERFLKRDNPTRCATCTNGARVCVEINISKESLLGVWIGMPKNLQVFFQEFVYETLLTYCMKCKIQGHNLKTCKKETQRCDLDAKTLKDSGKAENVWVRKSRDLVVEEVFEEVENNPTFFKSALRWFQKA